MASRAASDALIRALSLASEKSFGHSSSGHSRASPLRDQSSVPSSRRRPQIITLDGKGERDPLEGDLLSSAIFPWRGSAEDGRAYALGGLDV